MVGHLYNGPTDPRRDGGFTVFCMGINHGAFATPLVCGTVGQKVNWHLGFALAGVGMAIGLVIYLFGMRTLSPHSSRRPHPARCGGQRSTLRKGLFWLAIAVVSYSAVAGTGHFTLNWARPSRWRSSGCPSRPGRSCGSSTTGTSRRWRTGR